MRVGLNVLYLVPGQVGGSEIYARRLIDAVARERPGLELLVYCGREAAPALAAEGWPANVRIRPLAVRAAIKPLRALAETTLLPLVAARDGVALLHSLGTTSPPVTRVPAIATVLDLIYEHFPETFPAPARAGLRALVGPGARRARRVITISHAVERDVVERLRVPADRVRVVYPGFGMRAPAAPTPEGTLRERLGLGDARVVLCVSAALAHKNLPRLIEAFGALADLGDTRLVIAGHAGREQLELPEAVVHTGWISDEDLEGLYGLATCCVYPSLHEGFGMPVLEAMARGVPLACSNATSLPEVAGDAAELFDPTDTAAIAAAMRRLLSDPGRASELVAAGTERATAFTWERCARKTIAVYDEVLRVP